MASLLDAGGACRDEQCTRVEVHPAHDAIPLRGRTPKACPRCLESVQNGKCVSCGWFRANSTKLCAGPWVICNPCVGAACTWCAGAGVLPRARHSLAARAGHVPPPAPASPPARRAARTRDGGGSIGICRSSPFMRALRVWR